MDTLKIEIKATELANAINNLASALARGAVQTITCELSDTHQNPTNESGVSESSNKSNEPAQEDPKPDKPKLSERAAQKTQSASDYTIEDVRAAFGAYAKKHGKDKAKEILARFGANKVTEIKESDYSGAMSAVKE